MTCWTPAALAQRMHGHAAVRAIHRCEQGNNVEFSVLTHSVKRPGTVFSAAPRQPRFRPTGVLRL
jgi:hypothetical protein